MENLDSFAGGSGIREEKLTTVLVCILLGSYKGMLYDSINKFRRDGEAS